MKHNTAEGNRINGRRYRTTPEGRLAVELREERGDQGSVHVDNLQATIRPADGEPPPRPLRRQQWAGPQSTEDAKVDPQRRLCVKPAAQHGDHDPKVNNMKAAPGPAPLAKGEGSEAVGAIRQGEGQRRHKNPSPPSGERVGSRGTCPQKGEKGDGKRRHKNPKVEEKRWTRPHEGGKRSRLSARQLAALRALRLADIEPNPGPTDREYEEVDAAILDWDYTEIHVFVFSRPFVPGHPLFTVTTEGRWDQGTVESDGDSSEEELETLPPLEMTDQEFHAWVLRSDHHLQRFREFLAMPDASSYTTRQWQYVQEEMSQLEWVGEVLRTDLVQLRLAYIHRYGSGSPLGWQRDLTEEGVEPNPGPPKATTKAKGLVDKEACLPVSCPRPEEIHWHKKATPTESKEGGKAPLPSGQVRIIKRETAQGQNFSRHYAVSQYEFRECRRCLAGEVHFHPPALIVENTKLLARGAYKRALVEKERVRADEESQGATDATLEKEEDELVQALNLFLATQEEDKEPAEAPKKVWKPKKLVGPVQPVESALSASPKGASPQEDQSLITLPEGQGPIAAESGILSGGASVGGPSKGKGCKPCSSNDRSQLDEHPGPAGQGGVLRHFHSLPPQQQRQYLGEKLYPLVQALEPEQAGKITGMLLDITTGEIFNLLGDEQALVAKVSEAIAVLQSASGEGAEAAEGSLVSKVLGGAVGVQALFPGSILPRAVETGTLEHGVKLVRDSQVMGVLSGAVDVDVIFPPAPEEPLPPQRPENHPATKVVQFGGLPGLPKSGLLTWLHRGNKYSRRVPWDWVPSEEEKHRVVEDPNPCGETALDMWQACESQHDQLIMVRIPHRPGPGQAGNHFKVSTAGRWRNFREFLFDLAAKVVVPQHGTVVADLPGAGSTWLECEPLVDAFYDMLGSSRFRVTRNTRAGLGDILAGMGWTHWYKARVYKKFVDQILEGPTTSWWTTVSMGSVNESANNQILTMLTQQGFRTDAVIKALPAREQTDVLLATAAFLVVLKTIESTVVGASLARVSSAPPNVPDATSLKDRSGVA